MDRVGTKEIRGSQSGLLEYNDQITKGQYFFEQTQGGFHACFDSVERTLEHFFISFDSLDTHVNLGGRKMLEECNYKLE